MDIVVVGELNVDLIAEGLNTLPELGKEKIISNLTLTLGSSSAIFAADIARSGMEVGFIGKVGDDPYGEFVINSLRELEINTSKILIDPDVKTGVTISLAYPEDKAQMTYLGSIEELGWTDINLEYLYQAKHLHLSSYFLQNKLKRDCLKLFKSAKEHNLSVSFDPGYDPEERWDRERIYEMLKYVDIFLPNETEAKNITGKDNWREALSDLSKYTDMIVIKRGSKGAVVKRGEKMIEIGAKSLGVIDTTGAGDAFNAGFIYGYLNKLPLEKCLALGNFCGARVTMRAGGTRGFPTREELKEEVS
jgi:sugar/nucleoside kinase (ribokinase family)